MKPIVVNLTSRRLDLIVDRHAPPVGIDLDLPGDPDDWIDALGRMSEPLRTLIHNAGLKGRHAIIYYRSPSMTCQLLSNAARHRREAEQAARLACLGTSPHGSERTIASVRMVGRDRSGDPPRAHVVAAADRADVAEAVVRVVQSAGLLVTVAAPLESTILARRVRAALDGMEEARGWLHVGDERSCFIAAANGRIRVNRHIGLGVQRLIDAYARPISVPGAGQPIQFTHEQAESLMRQFGIPGRDQIVDPTHSLTGAQLLPTVQPVLQRFIIELKQSLRFGLGEERGEMTVTLTGPGAHVRGLAELLAAGVEITIQSDGPDRIESNDANERNVELRERPDDDDDPVVNLMPSSLLAMDLGRRYRRGLLIGVVAAGFLIAADAFRLERAVDRSEARLERVEAEHARHQSLVSRQTTVNQSDAALTALLGRITTAAECTPDWAAVLHEVSNLAPPNVRLTRLNASFGEHQSIGRAQLTIDGYVFDGDDDALSRYITALRSTPLFGDVKLDQVRRTIVDGREARQFGVFIEPVLLPARHTRLAAVEEAAP